MLNQAVLEAMYSVPYVETYLDIVENLPDEIQKYLSKIRELNVSYESHVREVEALTNQHNSSTDQAARKRYLLKIQMALIAAQEIGDEKLAIMEQVGDTIETRTKPIDDIFYNLPSVVTSEHVKEKKEKDPEPHSVEHEDLSKEKDKSFSDKISSSEPSSAPRKRTRRKIEKVETDNEVIEYSSTPLPRSSATIAVPKKPQSDLSGKKKKRKSRQPREQKKEASPPPDEDLEIDPDEPTYCICNRVSFGQMVMCDNDLCSLQWFHFSCVGVTNTPRGKWYCPKCRKVKSNAAQPKKQLGDKSDKHKDK